MKDPNHIINALMPETVMDNYDALVRHGLKLDLEELIAQLDYISVLENWDEFIRRGVSVDTLVKRCFLSIDYCQEIESLLDDGIEVEKLFSLSNNLLEIMSDLSDFVYDIVSTMHKHGLPSTTIKEWIDAHPAPELIDDIVRNTNLWRRLGINSSDYTNTWIDQKVEACFRTGIISSLPELISPRQILDYCTMREIIEWVRPDRFYAFLEGPYITGGGDIDLLATKFIDEIGYSSNFDESDLMMDLLLAGATVIDSEQFIDCIDVSLLDDYDKGMYYEDLKNIGFNERLLEKFLH